MALRDTATEHADLDVLVLHPGVVRTGLGDRPGLLGAVMRSVKRRWEDPETCGRRLATILEEPDRWSPSGHATWRDESTPVPWPAIASDPATASAVRAATRTAERIAGPA